MKIREYQPEDLDALRSIHAAQGFAYSLPELTNPLFVTKLVLAEDAGDTQQTEDGVLQCAAIRSANEKIVGAALLRLTAEAYLLLDPRKGSPQERWRSLLALHSAAERDAWQRGIEDVHAWLPPSIARKFGKRMEKLGWVRDDAWTPYCRRLTDPTKS